MFSTLCGTYFTFKCTLKSRLKFVSILTSLKVRPSGNWLTRSGCIEECAEPHSSVSSVADLRTEGRWFNPRLGHYSFDSHCNRQGFPSTFC